MNIGNLKIENTNLIRKGKNEKLLSFKPSDNKNIFESSSVLIKI